MTTDRLALAHVIEDAGIERAKAERVASAIFDAISDNVATKQDCRGGADGDCRCADGTEGRYRRRAR